MRKRNFLYDLNLLVETFTSLWTKNYVAPYEYWVPYFSFLLILIAVAVIALVVGGIEVAVETEVTAAAVVA